MKPIRNYDVYFEMFGRKMRMRVLAENEQAAKEMVKEKIIFHKVTKPDEAFNKCVDIIDNMIDLVDKMGNKNGTKA